MVCARATATGRAECGWALGARHYNFVSQVSAIYKVVRQFPYGPAAVFGVEWLFQPQISLFLECFRGLAWPLLSI